MFPNKSLSLSLRVSLSLARAATGASSPCRPSGWPSREQTDIAFKGLQDSKKERGEPQRGPSVTTWRHRHTDARLTSSRHPPSHDAERAADRQTNSQHISTLMRKLLPVGCIRYSLRMGFKTLSFFCPVLGGPPAEAGSAPLRRADRCGVSCRRRSGSSISPVGSPLESGVSPAHIGPSTAAGNACPRAAPETTPLWRLFLIKLSLSLSLSLSHRVCGLWPLEPEGLWSLEGVLSPLSR